MKYRLPKNGWLEKPILICGFERSGTNLVVSLLDNHPDLVVFSPGHLFLFGNSRYKITNLEQKIQYFLDKLIMRKIKKGIIPGRKILNINFDFNQFESLFRTIPQKNNWKETIKGLFYSLYLTMNEKSKKSFWVENTPLNELNRKKIISVFPKAKMIHIIRDPRDNWTAWKKTGEKHYKRNISQFIFFYIKSIIAASESHREKNYLIFNYENLVNNPALVLKDLEKIGVKWHDSLLSPTKFGISWSGNSSSGKRHNGISKISVGKFKELPLNELRILEKFCMPFFIWYKNDFYGKPQIKRDYMDLLKVEKISSYIYTLRLFFLLEFSKLK